MCTARATAARRVADDEFHQLAGCTVSAAVGAFQFVGVAAAQCDVGDLGELTGLGPGPQLLPSTDPVDQFVVTDPAGLGPGQRGGKVGSGILGQVAVGAGVQFGVVSPTRPTERPPSCRSGRLRISLLRRLY